MAKLHFFYGVMNSGKSTLLLQAAHNYKSNGWEVLLLSPAINDRNGVGVIHSRIGIETEAEVWDAESLLPRIESLHSRHHKMVIIIDEVQFLEESAIKLLTYIVDVYSIPVMCYGLKNNSNHELFNKTVEQLIAHADELKEIKTVCFCGSKATHINRYDENFDMVLDGDIVSLGAEEKYISTCRKHALYDYGLTKLILRRKNNES